MATSPGRAPTRRQDCSAAKSAIDCHGFKGDSSSSVKWPATAMEDHVSSCAWMYLDVHFGCRPSELPQRYIPSLSEGILLLAELSAFDKGDHGQFSLSGCVQEGKGRVRVDISPGPSARKLFNASTQRKDRRCGLRLTWRHCERLPLQSRLGRDDELVAESAQRVRLVERSGILFAIGVLGKTILVHRCLSAVVVDDWC